MNQTEIALIQEFINDTGIISSFDGSLLIPLNKDLHAEDLISLCKKYHQSRLNAILTKIEELYTGHTSDAISKVREKDKERFKSLIEEHVSQ